MSTTAELEQKVKDLTKERNDAIKEKNELQEQLDQVTEDTDEIVRGLTNQNTVFELTKGSWYTLPFIPQDLGFEEIEKKVDGLPTIRIYHRDGIALSKDHDNLWIIAKDDDRPKFKIDNKFHAYHILRGMGVDFSEFL